METILNKEIINILKTFGNKYIIEGNMNKNKVIQDLDSYNDELLSKLIGSELIKENFTIKINSNIVIQLNKLIKVFEVDEYWKDSFTKYTKKIGLTSNNKFIDESTEIVLDFPYKDTTLKASMSKEDNDEEDLSPYEPFLNEVIAKEEIDVLLDKKILLKSKKYDNNYAHDVDSFSNDDNLIIKGNNLLGLHSLKKRYAGRIKSIIIDPPYYFNKNKSNDSFMYNSNFKLSSWLTFMKNRLEVSKELLKDDGIIAVMVGIDGYSHLKLLADEVFDVYKERKNYIGTITWRKTDNQTNIGDFANVVDYILLYRKNSDTKLNRLPLTERAKKEYSYKDEKGNYRRANILDQTRGRHVYNITTPEGSILKGPWMIEKKEYEELKKNNGIHWPEKGKQIPYGKTYLKDSIEKGQITSDFWDGSYGTNQRSADEIKILFDNRVFNYAKPERLIMNLISLTSEKGDIVLDCFMGSATTQAVAHKMNRQYIGIEQMDYINTVSIPRLLKVIKGEQGGISKDVNWLGGGSFVYVELMDKNQEFAKSIINAKDKSELEDILKVMLETPDLDFRVDLKEIKKSLWELSHDEQKRLLIKILDKNQLYYNYSEIDDKNVRKLISDNDYKFNKNFYKDGVDQVDEKE